MIGACDICDRQNVPVSHFRVDQTSAQCETSACYICQGDEPDPYGELAAVGVPVLAEVVAVVLGFCSAYVWIAIYATRGHAS